MRTSGCGVFADPVTGKQWLITVTMPGSVPKEEMERQVEAAANSHLGQEVEADDPLMDAVDAASVGLLFVPVPGSRFVGIPIVQGIGRAGIWFWRLFRVYRVYRVAVRCSAISLVVLWAEKDTTDKPAEKKKKKKKKKAKKTPKEKKDDVPDWGKRNPPQDGEGRAEWLKRIFKEQDRSPGKKGPGSEWSKLKKWFDQKWGRK